MVYGVVNVNALQNTPFVLFILQNAERGGLLHRPAFLPQCMNDCIVESMESTNNTPLAEEQGVARATAKMHRAELERFRREMKRKEEEIRKQRAREKMEREAREIVLASSWPQQQEAISSFDEKVSQLLF